MAFSVTFSSLFIFVRYQKQSAFVGVMSRGFGGSWLGSSELFYIFFDRILSSKEHLYHRLGCYERQG